MTDMGYSAFKAQNGSHTSGEKALTKDQVKKLLSSITDLEEEALLRLALNAGIRRNDIVGIKRDGTNTTLRKVGFWESKKKRFKTVDISEETARVLEMWLNATKNIKSDYVFPPRKKGAVHMGDATAYRILQDNLLKAGLPRRPFHALRSTCIKLCQAQGWEIEKTAKHVGDSVRVIQEHYTTPSEEEMSEAMKNKPNV